MNKSLINEFFMKRCFDLALLGKGYVGTNPMVGAVLVHDNLIIGEGFHERFGHAHAEVNAVHSVAAKHRHLIPKSTLYVSLEPCCFHGKTPACTSLIIEQKIPKVVISCLDNSPEVAGKGVAILKDAGIEVITGVLEKEGKKISRVRSTIVAKNRPYVILKYAQTKNLKFAPSSLEQKWITTPFSKRLTHQWRMEAGAILIGTNTALADNPQLNNRYFYGPSPLRIVLDRNLKLPKDLLLFSDHLPTVIVTEKAPTTSEGYKNPNLTFLELPFHERLLLRILKFVKQQNIGILMVEGGVQLINSFIEQGFWDEARVLIGDKHWKKGKEAPSIPSEKFNRKSFGPEEVLIFYKS